MHGRSDPPAAEGAHFAGAKPWAPAIPSQERWCPIHMSATYLRDADNGYSGGYVYGRTDNASVQQVEALLAALEGAPPRR